MPNETIVRVQTSQYICVFANQEKCTVPKLKMQHYTIFLVVAICSCIALCIATEVDNQYDHHADTFKTLDTTDELNNGAEVHTRTKRTLFLKKKILGAGLLGFGVGVAKGYKLGYHSAPEVHRIYVSSPPAVKYVEYVEKPVYISRIIEKPAPVYKAAHLDYEPSWSQPDPSPHYGSW
ncbi:mam domain-containing glycosylphosphatidylinositol anchor protein 1 [Vespula maculifrons]|uniref:Mam domain-containing glycosylphosphatidylinositol anchor protein 1 n=1 Tax=Vespula maculifrons TaxID=7453 RepID=A0ABD2B6C0_VESMC